MRAVAVVVAIAAACSRHDAPAVDFVAAGVPSPDRAWSNADHAAAVAALERASGGDRERLPRFGTAIFARVVELSPDDPAGAIAPRLGAIVERIDSLRRATHLYSPGLDTPTREIIELFGAQLRLYARFEPLVEPFLATFPPDDPRLPARRAGLASAREGVQEMLVGALMIADEKRVAEADRRAMLDFVATAAPVVSPRLEPAKRAELVERARALADATTGPVHDAALAVVRSLGS